MKQTKKPLWGEHPNCMADYGADNVGSMHGIVRPTSLWPSSSRGKEVRVIIQTAKGLKCKNHIRPTFSQVIQLLKTHMSISVKPIPC